MNLQAANKNFKWILYTPLYWKRAFCKSEINFRRGYGSIKTTGSLFRKDKQHC